jgi:site-specific recombinase XerD
MTSLRYLKRIKQTFYVNVVVPPEVAHIIGKKSIWRTTHTGDPHEASRIRDVILPQIRKEIAVARATLRQHKAPADRSMEALIALEAWATHQTRMPPDYKGDFTPTPFTIATADILQRIVDDPDAHSEVEGFDEYVARCLTAHGCPATAADGLISTMRSHAALTFLYALKFHEKGRQAAVFMERARRLTAQGASTFDVVPVAAEKTMPVPSLLISTLYLKWVTSFRPSAKERQRLDHQFQRLIECVGDKPANFLTKADVTDFMALVVRFPGRKRSAKLAVLPMRELVDQFEKINARAAAHGEPPIQTLTKVSVENWYAAFKRCWEYAAATDLVDQNPWAGLKKFVVAGAPSQKRRHFEPEEIQHIFAQPLFQQPEIRDAKWWLPILSLFHGGRLSELAALPLSDVCQTRRGTWYFDITPTAARRLKTPGSERHIPLHPHILLLGFEEYIAELRKNGHSWLFPDLDHATRHGAGHAFSKWWGAYMDKIGLTDKSISHHSWRHTWKRHARISSVKEEIHDILGSRLIHSQKATIMAMATPERKLSASLS